MANVIRVQPIVRIVLVQDAQNAKMDTLFQVMNALHADKTAKNAQMETHA